MAIKISSISLISRRLFFFFQLFFIQPINNLTNVKEDKKRRKRRIISMFRLVEVLFLSFSIILSCLYFLDVAFYFFSLSFSCTKYQSTRQGVFTFILDQVGSNFSSDKRIIEIIDVNGLNFSQIIAIYCSLCNCRSWTKSIMVMSCTQLHRGLLTSMKRESFIRISNQPTSW